MTYPTPFTCSRFYIPLPMAERKDDVSVDGDVYTCPNAESSPAATMVLSVMTSIYGVKPVASAYVSHVCRGWAVS